MYYYGEWYLRGKEKRTIGSIRPLMILAIGNTFLGYFPHTILSDDPMLPTAVDIGSVGYGKKQEYFEPYTVVIDALIEAGFTLHTPLGKRMSTTHAHFLRM